MSEADAPAPERPPGESSRELAEVYLLMNHMADSMSASLELALQPRPNSTEPDITIQQIFEIRSPPAGSEQQQAQQFRTIMVAKDRLAHAAYPATSLSIAFTYLSTAEGEASRIRKMVSSLWRRRDVLPHAQSTMVEFALQAFPSLGSKRGRLHTTVLVLIGVLVSLLVTSTLTTWSLATGQHLMEILDSARSRRETLYPQVLAAEEKAQHSIDAKVAAAEQMISDRNVQAVAATDLLEQSRALAARAAAAMMPLPAAPAVLPPAAAPQSRHGAGGGKAIVPTVAAPPVPDDRAALEVAAIRLVQAATLFGEGAAALKKAEAPVVDVEFCLRPALWPRVTSADGHDRLELFESVEQADLCPRYISLQTQIDQARSELAEWNSERLSRHLLYRSPPANSEQIARVLLQVLNYNVLPFVLGALASAAAALRSLSYKVEANTLLPRDLTFVWVRVTLGAFLGAIIGLFISPTGAENLFALANFGTAAASVQGASQIALSPAAYAVLAGFATDRIFSWLDRFITHIFNFGDADPAADSGKAKSSAPGPR